MTVTAAGDAAYRAADDDAYLLSPMPAAYAAVEDIWSIWCRYMDQQGLDDGFQTVRAEPAEARWDTPAH